VEGDKGGQGMKELIITDNSSETITVKWDGERFAIVQQLKFLEPPPYVIILNPREMKSLISFASKIGDK